MGLHRLALILALVGVWEVAARLHWLDPTFFSPPSDVARALGDLALNDRIVAAATLTLVQVVYAFSLAAVVGIVVGAAIGLSPFAYRTFRPAVLLLFGLPKMVMLPLFILFFGIGVTSKAIFGFALGVFPVLLNVIAGVRMVDAALLTAAYAMGASRTDLVFKVVIPSAMPSIMTSLRLGMTQTVLGVLLAELYGASSGLGFYVAQYTQSFKPAYVFALFLAIAAIAITVNEILRWLERWAGRWREDALDVTAR
jgi:ABC-type nitrate/sulfonate/bicarbonate transport system permease component